MHTVNTRFATLVAVLVGTGMAGDVQPPSARAKSIAASLAALAVEYRAPFVIDTSTLVTLPAVTRDDMTFLKATLRSGYIWTDRTVPKACEKVTPKCGGVSVVGYAEEGAVAIVRTVTFPVGGCGGGGEILHVSLSTSAILKHLYAGSGSCVSRDSTDRTRSK